MKTKSSFPSWRDFFSLCPACVPRYWEGVFVSVYTYSARFCHLVVISSLGDSLYLCFPPGHLEDLWLLILGVSMVLSIYWLSTVNRTSHLHSLPCHSVWYGYFLTLYSEVICLCLFSLLALPNILTPSYRNGSQSANLHPFPIISFLLFLVGIYNICILFCIHNSQSF